jgi:tetratricopeptide (TPR) repeat protein
MPICALILAALLAQAGSPPPVGADAKAKATGLLKQGSALFEQGEYQFALDKFEEAYAVFPSPKLQFNIAQANASLGRPVEALNAYETFVARGADASPDALADAWRSIAELRAKLGQLKIDCSPAGASVAVDGKEVGLSPIREAIWTRPGAHQVTAQREHYAAAIEAVTTVAGKATTVTIRLRSSVAEPAPLAIASPQATSPVVELQAPSSRAGAPTTRTPYKTYFWAGVGTTGALVIGAIVAGVAANAKFSDLENSCGRTVEGCSDTQIDSVKTRAHLATALWGLAGAAAIGTGVVFYLDSQDRGAAVAWNF